MNASTFSGNVGDQIRISLSMPDVARIEANRFGWTQLTIAESPEMLILAITIEVLHKIMVSGCFKLSTLPLKD